MTSTRFKNAFTLVEVLTVITIISLMAGLIVTSVAGVTKSARESRTQNIIGVIDSVLAEQYESYKYRALAVEIPQMFNPANLEQGSTNTEIGFEVLASETARVRMMMIRDLQRMEMPDRLSDITSAPQILRAAANPVLRNNSTNQILNTRDQKSQRRMFPVSWYDATADYASRRDNVPSKLSAYRDRIRSIASLNGGVFDFTAAASLQNQGAECLYLIMSTSFVNGAPAIRMIPTSNIVDTDGDGLHEITDGWGQPMNFVRWPVGYFDPELSIDTTVADDFDLFRSDYAYIVDPSTSMVAIPTDVNAVPQAHTPPWSMRPLVFSSGANKLAGMATNPWTSTGAEDSDFNYRDSAWDWGVNANNYGVQEVLGRGRGVGSTTYTSHPYPDPYLRSFVASNQVSSAFGGLLPGQQFTTANALEEVSDNITNYQLQAAAQ